MDPSRNALNALYVCPTPEICFLVKAFRQVIHANIFALARSMDKSAVSYIYADVRHLAFAGSGKKNEITFQKVVLFNRCTCLVLLLR